MSGRGGENSDFAAGAEPLATVICVDIEQGTEKRHRTLASAAALCTGTRTGPVSRPLRSNRR